MRKMLIVLLTILLVGCANGKTLETIFEEPPQLTISAGDKNNTAVRGVYGWFITNKDGTGQGNDASSVPPPELVRYQKDSLIVKPNASISLNFDVKPETCKVNI